MQCYRAHELWSPKKAVITGLLQRYDKETKSLLVLRVEHLRAVFEKHPIEGQPQP